MHLFYFVFLPPSLCICTTQEPNITVKNSRDTVLSRNDFCHMVSEKLDTVSKERVYMRQQAQNQAREQGKSYKEIMVIKHNSIFLYNIVFSLSR